MDTEFSCVGEVVFLLVVHLLVVKQLDMAAVGDIGIGEYGLVHIGPVRVAKRNAGKSVNLRIHERVIIVSVARPVIVRGVEAEVVAERDVFVYLELKLAAEVVLVVLVRTHTECSFLVFVAAGEVVFEEL